MNIPSYIKDSERAIAVQIVNLGWNFVPTGMRLLPTDLSWWIKDNLECVLRYLNDPLWLAGITNNRAGMVSDIGYTLIGLRKRGPLPERFKHSAASWIAYLEKEKELT